MAKKKKKSKLLYYLLGAVGVLIVFVMVGKSNGWIGGVKKITVEMENAKKATIVEKVSASGAVQPVREIKISPDVAGEITQLNVEEGDSVTMGQLLVKIRPDNFINALERAQANYDQQTANLASAKASEARAKATLIRAEADYNRSKKLFDEKVLSEADWELTQQNYAVAQNDYESAKQSVAAARYILKSSKANVDDAQENLRLTSVFAPANGIVSKLDVEQGERVVGTQQFAGTEMLRIADLNKMEVRVDVNENDIIRVSLGDTAIIDVDSYTHLDKKFKGVVTSIANTANDKVSQDAVTEFEVKIRILNQSYVDLLDESTKFPFRPGMTASVEIVTDSKDNILSVPLSAVTTRNQDDLEKMMAKKGRGDNEEDAEGEDDAEDNTPVDADEVTEIVFVNDGGTAKVVKVKTGISDYENIEILEGLSEGDEIISGPFLAVSKRLKHGDAIEDKDKKKEGEKEEEVADNSN